MFRTAFPTASSVSVNRKREKNLAINIFASMFVLAKRKLFDN